MKTIYLPTLLIAMILFGCKSSTLEVVNESVMINYSLPTKSNVKLTVENSYYTKIATLVNTIQNAGGYSVRYDTSNLPEGVYFYTLETGNYKITKHFLLVK